MRSFTDSDGAVWPLRVNAAALKRVKDQCGIDFLDTEATDSMWDAIIGDPVEFMGVLRAVCEPEIVARNMTEPQFFERLTGKAMFEAKRNLADEIVDFFLDWQPAHGHTIKAALAAQLLTYAKAERMVKEKIGNAEGRLERAIDSIIDEAAEELEKELDKITNLSTSGKLSRSSPES